MQSSITCQWYWFWLTRFRDQRIVHDVRLFCKSTGQIFFGSMYLMGILPGIGNNGFRLHLFAQGPLAGYTYLVIAKKGWYGLSFAYGSFFLFVLLQKFFANMVSTSLYRQAQFEQDFAYNNTRVRTSAEQIAFYKGEYTSDCINIPRWPYGKEKNPHELWILHGQPEDFKSQKNSTERFVEEQCSSWLV